MTQPDMNQLLQQAQQMQAQLQAAQQEILASQVEGTAGNGLVSVTMSGNGEVSEVKIDPQVVDPEDVDTLQDLVQGAFADAHRKVAQLAEEKMGPLSQGFGDDAMGSLFQ
ncbi:YbaB/EbfC family nucleoid-associated protein [Corynebacterium poyangense]|uniref:Nucleoid-associated protein GP475_01310 n=1 Tax=Corynebacterium poyangense TaxID=2684405 RepID=A0A7H0SLJ0_9CORY|nr:YbaB/EbfC family nucleoid-associated protein [Corynebacterium poyangense]MBZ8177512.1 YbaB/EbfC family nucleoid-associated protein [Corynebacterium poyangense]QNQ89415.1 YbaB/EbfC family nucleoid-associated protein [Corynebacterium poyangense]